MRFKLLEVMLPALHEHVAAARIHAVFDRHFTAGLFPAGFSVPSTKPLSRALHPAETVNLFCTQSVAKGRHAACATEKFTS
jgi:hypothetical protein